MTSSPKPNRPGLAALFLGGAGLVYPFVVSLSLGRVPAGALVITAMAVVVGRLLLLRRTAAARALVPALAAVLAATSAMAVFDGAMAALAYPVLMSAAMAAAFGLSVRWPPSLVECFAALTQPSPSDKARAYMRKVSVVWCVFLTANAGFSAMTALAGDVRVWAVYNGFVSYVLMAALFGGEWLIRRRVQRHEALS